MQAKARLRSDWPIRYSNDRIGIPPRRFSLPLRSWGSLVTTTVFRMCASLVLMFRPRCSGLLIDRRHVFLAAGRADPNGALDFLELTLGRIVAHSSSLQKGAGAVENNRCASMRPKRPHLTVSHWRRSLVQHLPILPICRLLGLRFLPNGAGRVYVTVQVARMLLAAANEVIE